MFSLWTSEKQLVGEQVVSVVSHTLGLSPNLLDLDIGSLFSRVSVWVLTMYWENIVLDIEIIEFASELS